MMRSPFQPLAHLIDAAAEKWLSCEDGPEPEKRLVSEEITQAFKIGDNPELTFHGQRYLLSIIRSNPRPPDEFCIKVHKIALHD